jgi:hypothetical protein
MGRVVVIVITGVVLVDLGNFGANHMKGLGKRNGMHVFFSMV